MIYKLKKIVLLVASSFCASFYGFAQNKEELLKTNTQLIQKTETQKIKIDSLTKVIQKKEREIITIKNELEKFRKENEIAEQKQKETELNTFLNQKDEKLFTNFKHITFEITNKDSKFKYEQLKALNEMYLYLQKPLAIRLKEIENLKQLFDKTNKKDEFIKTLTEAQKKFRFEKIMNPCGLDIEDYDILMKELDILNLSNKAVIPKLENLKKKYTYPIQIELLNQKINELKNK